MAGKRDQHDLAEYFLRAAGVAAIWIDDGGHIGAADVASIDEQPGRIVYCCLRGDHFRLSYHLYEWKQSVQASREAIARKLEEMAAGLLIGLTKHVTAVERARAAVAAVEGAFETMAQRGEMREMNAAFKATRAVEPAIRYSDFIAAKKAAMLEDLAREACR
ncbi:hypothetical protein UB31_18885 [Bradyrhizobium sp. LTSP849]|uniref:hypothetical protein n=1 Tax=Bradyrhizobium sp. LTSP849 TaxID=1615890 RepID=UPI0005D14041|nr:hypothetical protein [Bradyrhizobium sp. LTSP849]KJC47321.1 hypothetical protein UB31_18885 [Bradyrhizobium sp. LTSP849]